MPRCEAIVPQSTRKTRPDQRGDLGVAHREMEQARIDAPYQPHEERFDLGDAIGQDERRQHRRNGEGGDDRAQQRVGIGARHGAEDLPLDALHGEQRQKRGDGDDDREENGSVHLHGSGEDGVELGRQSAVGDGGRLTWMRQVAEDALDHDHGRVDDDAEVDRPDRKQVGGISAHDRDDHGQEQRGRHGRGDDDRAAQIAQEHVLDEKDQRDAEEQIVQHRANRDGDELTAVVERHHLHARRQAAVGVERIDRRMHAADDVHRPFELLHEDDAEDHVGLVVAPRDPQPRRVADLNSRDVRQQDRHAVALREHRLLDIADRSDYADATHVHGLLPERDRAAADVGVAH